MGTYTWKQSHWLYDSIIFHHLCGVAAIF
ncbi:hypothetical protein V2146_12220 [Bacillus cereus]